MNTRKRIKDKLGFTNDESILKQNIVPYGADNTSRYKHVDELDLEDGITLKATLGPVDLGIYPYNGYTVYTVKASHENRIDIVAYEVYGKASMWWAIAYANNLRDPLKLETGTTLLIPDMSTLKRFPNPLS